MSKAVRHKASERCPICKTFNDKYLAEKKKSNDYASKLRGFQAKIDAEIETRKEIEKEAEQVKRELEIETAGKEVLVEEGKLNNIQILDYKQQVSDLKRAKEELLAKLEQSREKEIEFDLTEDEYEYSVNVYKEQIAELNSEIKRLKEEQVRLQDIIEAKDFIIEHKTERLGSVSRELLDKTKENAQNEELVAELKEKTETAENEISRLNQAIDTRKREFINLGEKHRELTNEHTKLKLQYDIVERDLKGLRYFKQEDMIKALLDRLDERLAKAKIYSLWDETRNTRQKNKQFYDAVMEELQRRKKKEEEAAAAEEKPEPTLKEKFDAWYRGKDLSK